MRKPAYTCNILVSCSEFTTNFKITRLGAKGFNIDYITLFLKDPALCVKGLIGDYQA